MQTFFSLFQIYFNKENIFFKYLHLKLNNTLKQESSNWQGRQFEEIINIIFKIYKKQKNAYTHKHVDKSWQTKQKVLPCVRIICQWMLFTERKESLKNDNLDRNLEGKSGKKKKLTDPVFLLISLYYLHCQ